MDYEGARAAGLPIGSGEVESGHKHVLRASRAGSQPAPVGQIPFTQVGHGSCVISLHPLKAMEAGVSDHVWSVEEIIGLSP